LGAVDDVKAKFDVDADDTKPSAIDVANLIPMTTINVIDTANVAESKSFIADAKVDNGTRGDSKSFSKNFNLSITCKPTNSITGMGNMHQFDGNDAFNWNDASSAGDAMSSVSAVIESKLEEMKEMQMEEHKKFKEMQQENQCKKQEEQRKQQEEEQKWQEKEYEKFMEMQQKQFEEMKEYLIKVESTTNNKSSVKHIENIDERVHARMLILHARRS